MLCRVDNSSVQFVADIPRLYDRHLGPFFFEPYARDLAKRVASAHPRRVLEIACGTGILTQQLRAALAPATHLVATDLNPPMLEIARSKRAMDGVEWRQADGTSLPFADGAFDAVVCQFGYMFFPDKIAGFREAARVLGPRGRLFFSVWSSLEDNPRGRIPHEAIDAFFSGDGPAFYRVPFGYHDETEIRRDLAVAGFGDVAIERLVLVGQTPSAEGVATGLVRGTPMFPMLVERGVDIRAIEEALARQLAAAGGTAPFRMTLAAKIVSARKP